MATRIYNLVTTTLVPVISQLTAVWDVLTNTTVRDLMLLHLPDPEERPLLHALVEQAIEWFTDYLPSVTTMTLFEWIFGTTLLIFVVFTLIKWIIGIIM